MIHLKLVGGQQVLASDGDAEKMLHFYDRLFDRLTREVEHTGSLSRYVGYQRAVGDQSHLHFLGIEVDAIRDIPEGMAAWDLDDHAWIVWHRECGREVIVSEQEMRWRWFESPSSGEARGRGVGEFAAPLPEVWSADERSAGQTFWISANAYLRPQDREAQRDPVRLVEYDPAWPEQFEAFAAWLGGALGGDLALRVAHYGSTSIPGMPAKPIIDVLVEVPSFAEAKRRIIPLFNDPLWEYWWYEGHMTFVRRDRLMGRRTHHVHVAPRGHAVWRGLAFRDYLRSHPKEASQYAALKSELAASHAQDRERYTQAKTAFVQDVLSKALPVIRPDG